MATAARPVFSPAAGRPKSSRGRSGPTVADVLRRYVPRYLKKHAGKLTPYQVKTLLELIHCRTPALGGFQWFCPQCGHTHIRFHSCRNRHCPTCTGPDRGRWLDRMLSYRLPVPYVHVVFTLPHELCEIILANPRVLYTLLVQSVSKTLTGLAAKELQATIGLIMVLHTWGQKMNLHVHFHCLVTVGGLALDGTRWVTACGQEQYLSEPELAARYRKLYLDGLRKLHREGKLELDGPLSWLADADIFEAWLSQLAAKHWKVHCQDAPENCQGPGAAMKYLSRYVVGTAISDSRIIADDGQHVTFDTKDYRHGGRRVPHTVTGEEFVARFLMHILPPRLNRVRYFGLYANCKRQASLKRCRELLGARAEGHELAENPSGASQQAEPPTVADSPACPNCGNTNMRFVGELPATWSWYAHRSMLPRFQRNGRSDRSRGPPKRKGGRAA